MRLRLIFSFLLLLTGCSPQRFFYYPNRVLYNDPDRTDFEHEIVSYPSLNGKKLYALLFRSQGAPRGMIVHFHGNYGNLSNHFPLALFLVKAGFDVLSFDYEGYGASEGTPSAKRLVEDGIASVRFAQGRQRVPPRGVAVFGQSLGGAIATVVAAREPLVKAAVLEASFSGFRAMAGTVLKRHFWTWPLLPVVLLVGGGPDAVDAIGKISPRPVFFVHGQDDSIVPVAMSRKLFEAAREPKTLWIVPGAGHLEVQRVAGAEYRRRLANFFDEALTSGTTSSSRTPVPGR
jgi:uncharacterized protein